MLTTFKHTHTDARMLQQRNFYPLGHVKERKVKFRQKGGMKSEWVSIWMNKWKMCSREMANVNKLLFDIGFTQKQADCRWICCYGEPQGVCEGWYSTSLIMNPKAFISPKPSIHSLLLTHTSPRERLHQGESVCSSMSGFDVSIFILIIFLFICIYKCVCVALNIHYSSMF